MNKSRIRDKHPGSATLTYTARVEVPDPGSSAIFYPWIRDGKIIRMRDKDPRDHISESLVTIFWVKFT